MNYLKLTEFYNKLESTSKRLEKTYIISEFLKSVKKEDVDHIVYLIRGKVFPPWDERKIGVSSRLMIKAIARATGESAFNVEKKWTKIGDLGLVVEELTKRKKQSTLRTTSLTTKKVFDNIRKLASLEGPGTVNRKIGLISELLTSASPLESKYIARAVLEEMRVGVAEGTLRDAIVWAFFGKELKLKYNKKENKIEIPDRNKYNSYVEKVQHAYDISTDFVVVVKDIMSKGLKGLEEAKITIGKPLNVMLYQKAKDLEDAFETIGTPLGVEFKFDGFRLMINNKDGDIKLFTRRLDNVTKQFPDVVEVVKKNVKGKNYILDSEIIGIDPKTKKWLPFQNVSQRIKRKYHIEEIVKKVPVMVNVFDILVYDNKSFLNKEFKERRKVIEKIVKKVKDEIQPAPQLVTSSIKEAKKFYNKALSLGNEGVMVKRLDAVYKPGSRVGYGVKVKPILETLDLVIVGAEWGTGKRATWLSSFVLACIDKGKFLKVGMVGTGIKEKAEEGVSFSELTRLLKPLIIKSKGKHVVIEPKIVVEVAYEEIQKSTTYESGYALRFPKLVRLRIDKGPKQANTLKDVERIYYKQRGRHEK